MSIIMKTVDLCRTFNTGFEEVHALKSINIEIEEAKLTILRGKSGSGKTTLINLLATMDDPTSGQIYLEDEEISKCSQEEKNNLRKSKIGVCFQSGALLSSLTAIENVEFALRVTKFPKNSRKSRAEEYLSLVGLQKRMHQYPYELSGGEAQRVAIARTLACNPKIIFMDEPTSALDSTTALKIVKILKELVYNENCTIVMTTHDPNMIEIADSVYTLSDGVVLNA